MKLNEDLIDDLDMDGDRLPVQSPLTKTRGRSRSPVMDSVCEESEVLRRASVDDLGSRG